MRAVVASEPGGPEVLKIVEVPTPEPGPGEVLIAVTAAGVNRADLLQRQGHYDPPKGTTHVLGLECSGTVAAVGDGVTGFAVGAPVCALLTGGGYAEYACVPAGQVAPLPAGLGLVEAAGLMETFATVWSNVFMVAGLQPGQTLLVHGGSSGIGSTAIQLATAFGARVVTTVGSAEKAEFCTRLGAARVVNYREDDFSQVLAEHDDRPDVILDIIGAKYLAANVAVLARGGHVVVIGMQGGVKGELNLGALLAKNGTISATSLRFRPIAEKSDIVSQLVAQVWPLVADKQVCPIVYRTFDWEEAAQAHRLLAESTHSGKVILTVRTPDSSPTLSA